MRAWIHAVLYRGLELLWILVSAEFLEQIPHGCQGAIKFSIMQGLVPVAPLFKGQLYLPKNCGKNK